MGYWDRTPVEKGKLKVKPKSYMDFPYLGIAFAPYVTYSVDTLRETNGTVLFGFKKSLNDKEPFVELYGDDVVILEDLR